jgi:hypothetical protein
LVTHNFHSYEFVGLELGLFALMGEFIYIRQKCTENLLLERFYYFFSVLKANFAGNLFQNFAF